MVLVLERKWIPITKYSRSQFLVNRILAIMLGRLEMSIVDVIQKFQELIDEVISQPLPSGEYDLDRFDAWSCDLISQCTSSKDTLMYDEGSTLTCKT